MKTNAENNRLNHMPSELSGAIASNNTQPSIQMMLFLILVLSMTATRYHHFSSVLHIADTSWAVFFLAGLYLRARWMLVALLTLAVVIDLAAVWVNGLGVTGCFSPAYPGLLLAYVALWGAGRMSLLTWRTHDSAMASLLSIAGWLTLGVLAAFAISNLSFWAWSGHFTTMTVSEYFQRVIGYLGHYMASTSLYVGIGVGLMIVTQTLALRRQNAPVTH